MKIECPSCQQHIEITQDQARGAEAGFLLPDPPLRSPRPSARDSSVRAWARTVHHLALTALIGVPGLPLILGIAQGVHNAQMSEYDQAPRWALGGLSWEAACFCLGAAFLLFCLAQLIAIRAAVERRSGD